MGRVSEKSWAPLLIALPHGLNVSGVTLWAVRLAGEAARSGRRVALVLHPEPPGQSRLDLPIAPGVEVLEADGLPSFDSARGDLSAFVPRYREAVRRLAREAGLPVGSPVVFSPNLHGDCYGVAAALCAAEPELVRVLGVQHSDNEYDARVLAHYAPIVGKFVGVSGHIAGLLRRRLGPRGADVAHVPYGVETPATLPVREPPEGRPLRLIYTGRLEHAQKRITALVHASDALAKAGVAHELVLVGDGPAAAEVDSMIAGSARVRRMAPVGPSRLTRLLEGADVFILASRFEGLSVSLLEAMAHGCVPVIARTNSGSAEAVDDGVSGVLVDIPPEADDAAAGAAMAEGLRRAVGLGIGRLSHAAWAAASERFRLPVHGARYAALANELAAAAPRWWPADRPCAFSAGEAAGTGSGSVPPDGPARLRAALQSLAGRSIVVHGTGQHTLQLASVLAASPAKIVAFADDDPAKAGTMLWGWPVVSPRDAGTTGATDTVISSWMHEGAIWDRRGVYTGQGLAVHRVYNR